MRKLFKSFVAMCLTISLMIPMIVRAEGNLYETTCTMTIYASKNTKPNFAKATGACEKDIDGYYSTEAKRFRTLGMYEGEVTNGQKENIALSSGKYVSAEITFYTVYDVKESKKKPTIAFKAFKGKTMKSIPVWNDTGATSKKVGTLPANAVVNITSLKGNRYAFTYKGTKRWIDKSAIKKVFKEFQVKTTVALNVRSGASSSHKVFGTLKKGSVVTVKGSNNGWYTISYKGKKAYIYAKYTSKTTGK